MNSTHHHVIALTIIMVFAIVGMVIATQPEQKHGAGIFVLHPKSVEAAERAHGLVSVRHEFKTGKFSAVVPEERIKELAVLADLEPVPLYQVSPSAIGKKPSGVRTCIP